MRNEVYQVGNVADLKMKANGDFFEHEKTFRRHPSAHGSLRIITKISQT